MEQKKSPYVVWHEAAITKKHRQQLLKQKGCLIWFTGLSGSGKSTIATSLEKALWEKGKLTYLLDGDNIRHGLNQDLGFSQEDRLENMRRIKEVGKLFVEASIITLATFVSPYEKEREKIKEALGESCIEVFVECDLAVCEERDPKGLYKKARKGEIKNFTGIDDPYEKPSNPHITLRSHEQSVEDCTQQILRYLEQKGFLEV
jgi:adenylylsulfate kinase